MNDVAAEYVEASRQNMHKFQPPRVIFVFCDGITESISCELVTSKCGWCMYMYMPVSSGTGTFFVLLYKLLEMT